MKSASNMHEILAFLRQLAINNERPWFKAHKIHFSKFEYVFSPCPAFTALCLFFAASEFSGSTTIFSPGNFLSRYFLANNS